MQVKIPMPYFVVFYNGMEQAPEQYELRLSDAFERQVDHPQIELICKVYNINAGNNSDILTANRSEVTKVMQLDYTFERQIELEREAARSKAWEQGMERGIEQGLERGIEQERLAMIRKMMQFGYTEDEYQNSMKK